MDGSDPKSRVAIKCRILIWVAGCSFKLHPIFFCFWFTPCFILLFDFAGAWAQVLRPYSNCICPLISLSRLMSYSLLAQHCLWSVLLSEPPLAWPQKPFSSYGSFSGVNSLGWNRSAQTLPANPWPLVFECQRVRTKVSWC